ncbi:hypothetical protein [Dactylosporangium sp. NPDC000521]|uniref:hypothetical protein n=1 Tax=Dactylosporangium sp. NPDC000521 TaxID=3363975 RepID=UPI0036A02F67
MAGVQASLGTVVSAGVMAYEHLLMFHHYVAVVTAEPDLPVPASPRPLPRLRRGIELRDVWFRYSPDHPWVLRGLNLTIPCCPAASGSGWRWRGRSCAATGTC